MQKEKIGAQQIENGYESKEVGVETSPEQILRTLENNGNAEKESLNAITERIQNSDSDFKQETAESGILSLLGEKVKKNKLLRAALVGLSLYSANPAFASGLEGILNKSETVESVGQEKSSDMKQFGNIPESRRKDFEQIFASAPEEAKRIMLDELENGNGLSDKDILDRNTNEDLDLLIMQNQMIDLQNSGELKDDGRIWKIGIGNASENQIRNWVDYLKDPEKFKAKKADWERKNRDGWQNVYPDRNPEGHKHANEDYDKVENL